MKQQTSSGTFVLDTVLYQELDTSFNPYKLGVTLSLLYYTRERSTLTQNISICVMCWSCLSIRLLNDC